MRIMRIANVPICLVVGHECLPNLPKILLDFNLSFSKFIVVTTEGLWERYGSCLDVSSAAIAAIFFVKGSSENDVQALEEKLRTFNRNLLILAFGGGKVIDVTKVAATRTGHNYFSIPTTLSNDGIYSPVASIKEGGRKKSVGAAIPLGILVDLSIVAKAPRESLLAGVGDIVSNISALEDWRLSEKAGIEQVDGFAYALSRMAVEYVLNAPVRSIDSGEFLYRLAYGLAISGLSMEIAGSSRPCSGAEHMFSHALDSEFPDLAKPHGIQVAFGTLLMEHWRGHDIQGLLNFYRQIGLPHSVTTIGLPKEVIVRALTEAPKMRDRYTILSEKPISVDSAYKLVEEFSDGG